MYQRELAFTHSNWLYLELLKLKGRYIKRRSYTFAIYKY